MHLGVVYLNLSKLYDSYWYPLAGEAGQENDLSTTTMDSTSGLYYKKFKIVNLRS